MKQEGVAELDKAEAKKKGKISSTEIPDKKACKHDGMVCKQKGNFEKMCRIELKYKTKNPTDEEEGGDTETQSTQSQLSEAEKAAGITKNPKQEQDIVPLCVHLPQVMSASPGL